METKLRNMRLYLDTEFNGHGGELISMALVSDLPGVTWYETCGLSPQAKIDLWVVDNVIPVLNKEVLSPYVFKVLFKDFILQFDNPEIICDWHADAAHFCNLLAGPDYGSSLDFSCRITIMKTPPGCPVSKVPHNALEDAIALRNWHQSVGKEIL